MLEPDLVMCGYALMLLDTALQDRLVSIRQPNNVLYIQSCCAVTTSQVCSEFIISFEDLDSDCNPRQEARGTAGNGRKTIRDKQLWLPQRTA